MTPRRDSKWWGWGDPAIVPELDDEALATLRERIGELEPWPLAAELEDFELPAAEPLPPALVEAVGEASVFTSTEDRLRHATGCGYADLARLRGGRLDAAPDAVVLPADADGAATRARRSAPPRASPSSPSAAAPASSAGSSRCVGPTASDQPRPGPAARRRGRPALAHRHASAPACAAPRPRRR